MPVPHYEIHQITSITEHPEGAVLGLSMGPDVLLERNHPYFPRMLERLRVCKQERGMVGIHLDAEGKVFDVGGAYQGKVLAVQEPQQGTADVEVWFEALDGPLLLAADHPAFAAYYHRLAQAKETGRPVWYVMKGGYLFAVLLISSEEDVELHQVAERKQSSPLDPG
jgi:hypothetical protein